MNSVFFVHFSVFSVFFVVVSFRYRKIRTHFFCSSAVCSTIASLIRIIYIYTRIVCEFIAKY